MYGTQHLVGTHREKVVLWDNADDAYGLVFESMEEVESWIADMRSVAKTVFEKGKKSEILDHPKMTG